MVMICNPKRIPLPDPPDPGPDPGPPDPTDPKDPKPQPQAQRVAAESSPYPSINSAVSGALAESLCRTISDAFAMLTKVESAFVEYVRGDISNSERAYEEAIGHARDAMTSLGKWESHANQRLASCDLQRIDPDVERSVRAVTYEDLGELVLPLIEESEAGEIWNTVAQSVESHGLRGILTAELDNAPRLRALARDVFVSLEHARSALRRGELFEWLTFRLETSYLEQTTMKLVAGILRLFLIANFSAAVETAAAKKRRDKAEKSAKT